MKMADEVNGKLNSHRAAVRDRSLENRHCFIGLQFEETPRRAGAFVTRPGTKESKYRTHILNIDL
jgi:hypothetical protein